MSQPILAIKVIIGDNFDPQGYEFDLQVPINKPLNKKSRENLAKVLVAAVQQGTQIVFPETRLDN